MSNYAYVAVDPTGLEMRGTIDVPDQGEALKRIKEMGLFPTKVLEADERKGRRTPARPRPRAHRSGLAASFARLGGKVKPAHLSVFTRQLATLVEAGMPLLRGLRTLHEQEENRALKAVIGELAIAIENGSSLGEAVAGHPKVFNRLYVNMVKAGEIGGALETTLRRLAEFMEKAQKIKGKIKGAMFYPCAVMAVAVAILIVLTVFVVPKFKMVFEDLMQGLPLPAFSVFIFNLCELVKNHIFLVGSLVAGAWLLLSLSVRTAWGREVFERLKLGLPVLGKVFRKVAISRFSRTLGTLVSNGVPILQALTIVKETAGNVLMGRLIADVHENVKQGEPMAPTLKASNLFPAMVAGMVDVGEQTGALPEMLMKIADTYDDEVDNATSAMTSLLEPIMIVFLAVVVGSIVVAMFLPLIWILTHGFDGPGGGA